MANDPHILVISDLHLGEGIGGPGRRDPEALDRELQAFLDHYAVVRRDDRPWRLVINGDMVDFLGVLLPAGDGDSDEDRVYGLGARAHAAERKLAAVIDHHHGVFRALARFLGAGNELSLVLGNHDAELHFAGVQELLRTALSQAWAAQLAAGATGRTLAELDAAIGFHPWFFFEEGVAWIEHGHQYDPYCSFEDVLEPASDDDEIDPNVGSVLVRYVTGRLEIDVDGQYNDGFWAHLRFAASRGVAGGLDILGGYRDMNRRLLRHWWARTPAALQARMTRSAARLRGIAVKARLAEEKLRGVRDLWMPPVVQDLSRLLRAVMLDRLIVLAATPLLLLTPLVTPWEWLPFVGLVLAGALGAGLREALRERETPDPREQMRRVSARLRDHLKVPVVVFGHTHDAVDDRHADGAYLNTGTWAPHGPKQAFTHVLIERTAAGVQAKLLEWRDGRSVERVAAKPG